jgi:hypothetical protein
MVVYHLGMTTTIAKAKLTGCNTATLIEQYELAISSYAGRLTNCSPRQKRIDFIVDLLSDRADAGDPAALAWFEHAKEN